MLAVVALLERLSDPRGRALLLLCLVPPHRAQTHGPCSRGVSHRTEFRRPDETPSGMPAAQIGTVPMQSDARQPIAGLCGDRAIKGRAAAWPNGA